MVLFPYCMSDLLSMLKKRLWGSDTPKVVSVNICMGDLLVILETRTRRSETPEMVFLIFLRVPP